MSNSELNEIDGEKYLKLNRNGEYYYKTNSNNGRYIFQKKSDKMEHESNLNTNYKRVIKTNISGYSLEQLKNAYDNYKEILKTLGFPDNNGIHSIKYILKEIEDAIEYKERNASTSSSNVRIPNEHGSIEHGSIEPCSIEHGSIEHGSIEHGSHFSDSNLEKITNIFPKISRHKAYEFLIIYEEIVKNGNIQKLNFDKGDKQITDQEVGDLLDFYNKKKKKFLPIIDCAHRTLNKHGITKHTINTVCK